MVNKNFIVPDYTIIVFEGKLYDLHNDYQLYEFEFDDVNRSCVLIWDMNGETSDGQILRLEFTGISRIVHRILGISGQSGANKEVTFIGYLPKEEFGRHSDFIAEDSADNSYHVIIKFEDDSYISIESEEIIASTR